jgi:hypothetical protein
MNNFGTFLNRKVLFYNSKAFNKQLVRPGSTETALRLCKGGIYRTLFLEGCVIKGSRKEIGAESCACSVNQLFIQKQQSIRK